MNEYKMCQSVHYRSNPVLSSIYTEMRDVIFLVSLHTQGLTYSFQCFKGSYHTLSTFTFRRGAEWKMCQSVAQKRILPLLIDGNVRCLLTVNVHPSRLDSFRKGPRVRSTQDTIDKHHLKYI